MSETNEKRNPAGVVATSYPNWPTTSSLQPNPPVTVLFVGLIAFGYSRTYKRAEIVFNDGDERHNLRISASENTQPVPLPLPTPITRISLGIIGRPPNVHFLEQGSDYDFGHVLNLNGPEFYPGKGPEAPFGVKLLVDQGTFYTDELTRFAFARHTVPIIPWPPLAGSSPRRYGRTIGIAIEPMVGEQVSLIVNQDTASQTEVKFPTQPGRKTRLLFDNECMENNAQCKHRPNSWIESQRSDFHFHRDVLNLSPWETRYGLIFAPGQLTKGGLDPITKHKPQSNDLAPCMVGGYSDPDGLPGS